MPGEFHKGERPPTWDVPPWELPGNARLDCEPHRGALLRWLANACFLGAFAWVFPCVTPLFAWLVPPTLSMVYSALALGALSAVLSLTVWVLAARDLAGMRAGRIDPNGQGETSFAKNRANLGFVLGMGFALAWGFVLIPSAAFLAGW